MSVSVLSTSPEEMERAARLLREAGAQIEATAERVLGSAPDPGAWSGLAALEATARARAVHRLTRSAASPPREAAAVVQECAGAARVATQEIHRWQRQGERARAEVVALRAPGPPPEPGLELLWRRKIEQLEHEVELARRRIAGVEEEFRQREQAAAQRLGRAWEVLHEVKDLATVPKKAVEAVGYAWGTGERVVRTTQVVVTLARARWAHAAQVRQRALRRAAHALSRLRRLVRVRGGATLGRLSLVPGPPTLLLSWFTAWGDLRDGGGYAGWRGDITRVAAAGGLIGGFMILPGSLIHPLVGGVGVGLLAAYTAWSLGNAAWDGGVVIIRYARKHGPSFAARVGVRMLLARQRAVERLHTMRSALPVVRAALRGEVGHRVKRAGEVLAPVLAPLTDPRRRVIGLPPGGPIRLPSRQVVHEVVGRLPDIEPVRDWWRSMGDPIRLPLVPLPPELPGPVQLGRWRP